jgi:hypothetical protein
MKELRIKTKDDLITIKNEHNNLMSNYKYKILICSGAGCVSSDCYEVYTAVLEELKEQNIMESTLVVQTVCTQVFQKPIHHLLQVVLQIHQHHTLTWLNKIRK